MGGQADVEVAYGVLGQGAVVPGLPHEGEPATGLLGAVPDLDHHQEVKGLKRTGASFTLWMKTQ